MSITKQDIIDYWSKLYENYSNDELIEFLKKNFEVDDINVITDKVLEDYKTRESKLKDILEYSFDYSEKENFFQREVIDFKSKINDAVMGCDLIINKTEFIKMQTDSLIEKLKKETHLILLNELMLHYNQQSINNINESLEKFFEEKFNTRLFRIECEAHYPQILRNYSTILTNHAQYLLDMLSNLMRDFELLNKELLSNSCYEIKSIVFDAGDTHSNGKSVSQINFDNGKIIYKPRNLSIENKFYDLLEIINKKSDNTLIESKRIRSISMANYAYCEFIEYEKIKSLKEFRRYYDNLGQILCLLYILNGTDIHSENIISRGDYPYLIDLESLFHSQIFINDDVYDEDFKLLLNSSMPTVIDTGLLPRKLVKNIDHEDYSIEIGGIGADKEEISPFKFLDINLDENNNLKVIKKFGFNKKNKNNPVDKFENDDLKIITTNLKNGFKKIYLWICENKEFVSSTVKELFDGECSRIILRPTYAYGKLLNISKEPHFLSSYIHTKVLYFKLGVDKNNYFNIVKSEVEQLLNNDIPVFYAYTNKLPLYDYNKNPLQILSSETSLNKSIIKINSLSLNDLDKQLSYIDQTMNLKESKLKADITDIKFELGDLEAQIEKEQAISLAKDIADLILDRKIEVRDTISWVSTNLLGSNEVEFGVGPVGNDLYLGNSGIALFLAYLGKFSGDDKYLDEAEKAISFNLNFLKRNQLYEYGNIGLYNGIGGNLLALSIINEIRPIKNAKEIVKYILENLITLIEKDISYDILSGAAGLITSIIEVYKFFPMYKNYIAEILERSYSHIANNRIRSNEETYWTSKTLTPYSGYAHGNAGILSALSKLKKHEEEILGKKLVDNHIIYEILTYQRRLYSAPNKNWRTSHLKETYSNGWCHGAPGILLSRLNMLKYGTFDKQTSEEISIALDTTIERGFGNNPTYCHGDLGNLEIINELALLTKDEKLRAQCEHTYISLYNKILTKKWNDTVFRNTESLGLMIGLAGWGYSILRFINKDEMYNIVNI